MPVFQTQFEKRSRVLSNPGSRIKPVYEAKVDSDGVIDLVQTGTENLYEYIQSHKDSCDINIIVKKFAAGDLDVLSQRQSMFVDTVGMPTSYAEMLNVVIAGRDTFEHLPVEVRAKFDHSFEKWMSTMDNWSEFSALMGLSAEPPSGGSGEDPAAAGAGGADPAESGGDSE